MSEADSIQSHTEYICYIWYLVLGMELRPKPIDMPIHGHVDGIIHMSKHGHDMEYKVVPTWQKMPMRCPSLCVDMGMTWNTGLHPDGERCP